MNTCPKLAIAKVWIMGMDHRYGSCPLKGYGSWVWIMGYGPPVGPRYGSGPYILSCSHIYIYLSTYIFIYLFVLFPCLSCHHSKFLRPRAKNVQLLLLLRCTFLTHRSAHPDGMLPAYHRHMDPDSCSPASQRCSGWLQGRTSTPHWRRVSMSLGGLALIHRLQYAKLEAMRLTEKKQ